MKDKNTYVVTLNVIQKKDVCRKLLSDRRNKNKIPEEVAYAFYIRRKAMMWLKHLPTNLYHFRKANVNFNYLCQKTSLLMLRALCKKAEITA